MEKYHIAYSQRSNTQQTFEEWIQINQPDTWDVIEFYNQYNKNQIKATQEIIQHIETKQFIPKDLISLWDNGFRQYEIDLKSPDGEIIAQNQSLREQIGRHELTILQDKKLDPLLIQSTYLPIQLRDNFLSFPKIHHNTLYSLYLLIQKHVPLIMMTLFIIIFVTCLSDEYYPGNTIDLLKILPQNRLNLYWHKVISSSTGLILIALLCLSVTYISTSYLLGGIGQGEYPIFVFDAKSIARQSHYTGFHGTVGRNQFYTFHFTNLATYVCQFMVLFLSSLYFITAIVQFIGAIVKNKYTTLALTTCFLGLGYTVSWQHIKHPLTTWLPFLYLNQRDILDGWIQVQSDRPVFHAYIGSTVLVLYGCLFLLFGAIAWKVKHIHRHTK